MYLYDRYDPSAARGRASYWLVGTNSRLLLVKASLVGPELDVHFEVTTPGGAVPFADEDLLIARRWAPISDREVIERIPIKASTRQITIDGVVCPTFYASYPLDERRLNVHAWAYVRNNGALEICSSAWVWVLEPEEALERLKDAVQHHVTHTCGRDGKVSLV